MYFNQGDKVATTLHFNQGDKVATNVFQSRRQGCHDKQTPDSPGMDKVFDLPNVWIVGPEVLIDNDAAACAEIEASLFCKVGIGPDSKPKDDNVWNSVKVWYE